MKTTKTKLSGIWKKDFKPKFKDYGVLQWFKYRPNSSLILDPLDIVRVYENNMGIEILPYKKT